MTDQTNSRFRSLLEEGAPKPFNADEDISFVFGAWKKLSGIFQRQRIYGGEGNMLRCLLLSRDLLKKTGHNRATHTLDWITSYTYSPPSYLSVSQHWDMDRKVTKHFLEEYWNKSNIIYSCFVMSNKAYHQKRKQWIELRMPTALFGFLRQLIISLFEFVARCGLCPGV